MMRIGVGLLIAAEGTDIESEVKSRYTEHGAYSEFLYVTKDQRGMSVVITKDVHGATSLLQRFIDETIFSHDVETVRFTALYGHKTVQTAPL
tara:strand:- start:84 stop:359 length:276 start_codon:yes stop_codon:yes gene_type:complete